eukprot:Seg1058.6 transcript_id=Seg1058.6/GoldUCD/mRNA.D3Y31 product="hypothetical protein" protein_id=Seg1058.6/GoldUCD/D3Y31
MAWHAVGFVAFESSILGKKREGKKEDFYETKQVVVMNIAPGVRETKRAPYPQQATAPPLSPYAPPGQPPPHYGPYPGLPPQPMMPPAYNIPGQAVPPPSPYPQTTSYGQATPYQPQGYYPSPNPPYHGTAPPTAHMQPHVQIHHYHNEHHGPPHHGQPHHEPPHHGHHGHHRHGRSLIGDVVHAGLHGFHGHHRGGKHH